ncbi:DinB family protein [Paenibacillus monticola]|uniref:DinB family protein n=1 Tax=Paenibacillus monticola TaxID=2666075 RepID=A0A7X2L027_9BACL|nr:DinB family protein [Paenibacillus monticola]MRN51683.1 DinB family protein [Paenibacillus monticola]
MNQFVFQQLEFIRQLTIKAVEGTSESTLDIIPEGFSNNLRWNLGHIYGVQEKFAFHFAGEPSVLPENFIRLFANGTKPADWNEETPTLEVLLEMLAQQPKRIQESFYNRLEEPVNNPLTTSSGLTLSTIGEFLSYTLYHEGMHFNTIKLLKRFAG